MLGNPAGFPGLNIGLADDVQLGCLAVVNVAHDGHHRRARHQVLGFVKLVQVNLPAGRMNDAAPALALLDLEPEAVLGADLLRNCLVNRLVDAGKNARLHQVGDNLEGLLLELFGQFPHNDRRLDRYDSGISGQDQLWRLRYLRTLARNLELLLLGSKPVAELPLGPKPVAGLPLGYRATHHAPARPNITSPAEFRALGLNRPHG